MYFEEIGGIIIIKLATVFSGIGAIEHALDRMHTIFTCDNGDVELELPKVSEDIDSIEKKLISIKINVKKINEKVHDEDITDYVS